MDSKLCLKLFFFFQFKQELQDESCSKEDLIERLTSLRVVTCMSCEQECSSASNLYKHIMRSFSCFTKKVCDGSPAVIHCVSCRDEFDDKSDLWRHLVSNHMLLAQHAGKNPPSLPLAFTVPTIRENHAQRNFFCAGRNLFFVERHGKPGSFALAELNQVVKPDVWGYTFYNIVGCPARLAQY